MNARRGITAATLFLIVAILGLAATAQQPRTDTARSKDNGLPRADSEAIRQVVFGIEKAWNTDNMEAYAKLLRDDVHWINVVGMHWRGRGEVMTAHIAYHNTLFKNHSIKTDSVEMRSIGDGYAIAVVTTTNDSFTTPEGQVIPQRQDRQTYVLTMDPRGWKIAHGHNVPVDHVAAQFDPVKLPRGNR